jgi:hypothetical protein
MKITPEKRREIIHKLDMQTNQTEQIHKPKKKLTMEQIHGTVKAENVFGGIGYSKEKQIVSHDEAIFNQTESMRKLI